MKNFGFGTMRLPMQGAEVDTRQLCAMVDLFLREGFTYFDTAHRYVDMKSEPALKTCLTSRYPRESYLLANKLTTDFFQSEADIRPFFQSQLEICGVDYFDYYLLHAQNAQFYKKYVSCGAYRILRELKDEGLVRHTGISFHDKAAVLDTILREQPELEVVQIQLNYADMDDESIESRKCLEVCRRYGKAVIVMEPVKGGNLANLPEEARAVLDALHGGSCASYAVRYAASCPGVMMVLSGMSNLEQMEDNLSYMKDFRPLNATEQAAIEQVCEIFRGKGFVGCTACHYCDGCPQGIKIPDLLSCLNAKKVFGDFNSSWYYMVHTLNAGKASDCVDCGRCEAACPQHLEIPALLREAAAIFEKR